MDIDIGDVANVRIRGGRRDAQQKAEAMEVRWRSEVEPHLAAAKVADLDGLSAKIAEAQALDASVKAKDVELQSLQAQIDSLADSTQKLARRSSAQRRAAPRSGTYLSKHSFRISQPSALNHHIRYESADSRRRRTLSRLARQRIKPVPPTLWRKNALRIRQSALNAAVVARDAALAAFPEGVAATLSDAQAALAAALDEQQKVAAELASLESTIAAQNERVEAAIREARAIAEQAQAGLDAASTERTNAITAHALQVGRLEELRRLRDGAGPRHRREQAEERNG